MRNRIAVVAVGLGLAVAGPLSAQGRPIELGLDAGFSTDLTEPKSSSIEFPIHQVRIGFFASDLFEIEPALSFNWIKPQDEDAFTLVSADLGLLIHFSPDASKARVYVRPVGGLTHAASGGESSTGFRAGAGLGVKVPVQSASHLAFRLEAGYVHGFENLDDGILESNNLLLLVGISFFTK